MIPRSLIVASAAACCLTAAMFSACDNRAALPPPGALPVRPYDPAQAAIGPSPSQELPSFGESVHTAPKTPAASLQEADAAIRWLRDTLSVRHSADR